MIGFNGVFGAKPRRFDYRPRFYDLEKDKREQRRRELLGDREEGAKGEDGVEGVKSYRPGAYLRDAIMQRRGISRTPKSDNKGRMGRLVLIMLVLILLSYWLMSSTGIEEFFTRWLTK